ncbi:MAG TPA: c-type cytochrome domain-containing protein, partial [Planctomycetaceae bacterium]|nr:c-type cytochrome domain-containing protein [Planctomycetaceae bacterium]
MRRWELLLVAALCVPTAVYAADEANAQAGRDLFEKSIRPALVQHCYECHSADKKVKGGLQLDSRDGWKTGGDSGPAIEPGKLDDSLLIEAIRYTGDLKMPPKGKLPERVIRDFERWVELGAPDPRDGTTAKPKENTVFQSGLSHWSYQPVRDVAAPVVAGDWPVGDIDRFILARLEQAKLRPSADADRTTLVRRLYF